MNEDYATLQWDESVKTNKVLDAEIVRLDAEYLAKISKTENK